MQYWLIKPPNFDPAKKYPVVFLIHGGPQGVWGDAWSTRWNPSLWAAQGWVVAAPNPSGSTTFGQGVVDRISGDWAGSCDDGDRRGGRRRREDALHRQRAHGDRRRQLRRLRRELDHRPAPNKFKAAVTHDGVFNLDSMCWRPRSCGSPNGSSAAARWDPKARAQFAKVSPHLYAHKIKTPTLIITNELDFRVPVDQGLQMFTVLQPQRRAQRSAGLPGRGALGPEGGSTAATGTRRCSGG